MLSIDVFLISKDEQAVTIETELADNAYAAMQVNGSNPVENVCPASYGWGPARYCISRSRRCPDTHLC
jgi:hypothetical protein